MGAAGAVNVMIPYMIMMLICLAGAVATSFLPETLGAKLPETLEDANQFGRTDKYFSFKPNRGYTVPTEQGIIKKWSQFGLAISLPKKYYNFLAIRNLHWLSL